jgi:hypothetical protein
MQDEVIPEKVQAAELIDDTGERDSPR